MRRSECGSRRPDAGHAVASRQLRGSCKERDIVVFDLVGGLREEMQFFAGAGGGDVEDAAHLLRFAIAANPVDPSLGFAGIGAFELQRRDEEFGEFVRFIRFGEAALEPGEKLRLVLPPRA